MQNSFFLPVKNKFRKQNNFSPGNWQVLEGKK